MPRRPAGSVRSRIEGTFRTTKSRLSYQAQPAREVLGTLLESLESEVSKPGIVSITGFATACPDSSRAEFLGALTFNRENITEFSHRQIWWMTADFADAFIHTVPDLDSWFDLRLQLRETFPSPTKGAPRREPSHAKGPSHRLEDALRRARSLVARFRREPANSKRVHFRAHELASSCC